MMFYESLSQNRILKYKYSTNCCAQASSIEIRESDATLKIYDFKETQKRDVD